MGWADADATDGGNNGRKEVMLNSIATTIGNYGANATLRKTDWTISQWHRERLNFGTSTKPVTASYKYRTNGFSGWYRWDIRVIYNANGW